MLILSWIFTLNNYISENIYRLQNRLKTIRLSLNTGKSKNFITCVVIKGKWCILKTAGDAQPYK
jgi:hypothetical protein